jgi:hypothetical protein
VAASQSIAGGAIDFAVSLLPRVAASQSIAAGAIDCEVICCLSACRVWLRVSQLRQVQSILRFFFVLLSFGLPCEAASQSISADAAGSAGKSILAVALFVANQSVPLSAAANQSIVAGAAGESSLPFGLPCAAASQ